jgi:hypothetical protein
MCKVNGHPCHVSSLLYEDGPEREYSGPSLYIVGEIYGPQEFQQQVLDALAGLRSQAVDLLDNEPES